MAKMGLNTMITIIVFILVLFIVSRVIMSFSDQGQTASKEVICRGSVIASQKIQMDTLLVQGQSPILCNAIDVGVLEGNREEIKYQISELAAKCWWMWLEGRVSDIFGVGKKEDPGCSVCYYFSIDGEMDQGIQSEELFFDEIEADHRNKTSIEATEFYNYMMSTYYDRKILYGGGTKQYIGDYYEFRGIRLDHPEEIRLKNIDTIPFQNTPHLQDFTQTINPTTQNKIAELGRTLLDEHDSLFFVVVADKIERNERIDARRLIESLGMNSGPNVYDAMLITIDATQGNIRLHAGQNLEESINELEIKSMLTASFQHVENKQSLDTALRNLVENIQRKVEREDEFLEGMRRDSFYAYVTNDATSPLHMTDPIDSNLKYAIAYSSGSSILNYFKGIAEHPGDFVYSAVASVFSIIPKTRYILGVPMVAASSAVGVSLNDGKNAIIGRVRGPNSDNALIISRAIYLDDMCQVLK